MASILPVVLAGGLGTRLWPLSRALYPKQFLALTSERSMMQETLLRLGELNALEPCIVCNEEHRFLVAEQCREVGESWSAILLESVPRNTAPAIALAACHVLANGDDPLLLVAPADHYIERPAAFVEAVCTSAQLANGGSLVTFGVLPSSPETGYGYIKAGERVATNAFSVDQFVEKPDLDTARSYVESGDFFWNSGIFLFKASRYVDELERLQPRMLECCRAAVSTGASDLDFFRPGSQFADSPSDSIDYAVMEKTDKSVVVPVDMGWSDVGSWSALRALGDLDANDNRITGDVLPIDTTNSLIHASDRLVVTIGVDELVVIETADAVLVATEGQAQKVKDVVQRIKDMSRTEHHAHRRVYRPWGSYASVDSGERYQVKRIVVKPHAQLSLQMHHHRSEHWIVVRGTAHVTCDDTTLILSENQSTYIPLGSKHRLGNPGKLPLELIEVQVGSYLGEDDIIRFDDDFGRD